MALMPPTPPQAQLGTAEQQEDLGSLFLMLILGFR